MNRAPYPLTIGLPVYNGELYLEPALKSILGQSYADFNLIISDNASTDRTAEICQDYTRQDRRIQFLENDTNMGAARNFNRLVELADGEYFKWAAHDDLMDKQFIERCIDILDRDPSVILAYSRAAKIDPAGKQIGNYDFPMQVDASDPVRRFRDLVLVNHFCIAIFGVHRLKTLKLTPLIGGFIGSDRTLLAELGLRGRFCELPEILFFRRDHPQTSGRAYSIHRRLVWFDSRNTRRIDLPYWRIGVEFYRAANRVPLRLSDRLACYRIVQAWYFRRKKQLLEDIKAATAETFPFSRSVARFAKNLLRNRARGGIL